MSWEAIPGMIKMVVSYTDPQELDKALALLKPMIKSYKTKEAENKADRRYNKAYIKCLDVGKA